MDYTKYKKWAKIGFWTLAGTSFFVLFYLVFNKNKKVSTLQGKIDLITNDEKRKYLEEKKKELSSKISVDDDKLREIDYKLKKLDQNREAAEARINGMSADEIADYFDKLGM